MESEVNPGFEQTSEIQSPSEAVTPTDPIAPITLTERVLTIDVLRGLALFGILAANMRGFAAPAVVYFDPRRFWTAMPDRLAQAFIDTFVQGKFITIFALLFGIGFAVQLERSRARGARFGGRYLIRLGILLMFGLVHGLFIWFGDILVPYALTGLFLLFFRNAKDRTIFFWAVPLYFVPLLITLVGMAFIMATGVEIPDPAGDPEVIARAMNAYALGSLGEIQAQRVREVFGQNWAYFPILFSQLLALFLAGMWTWRKRLLTPAPEKLGRYRTVMIWCLVLGVAGNVAATLIRWFDPAPPFPPSPLGLVAFVIQYFSVPILSTGYIIAIILLCQSPIWRRRFASGAAIGRTALSNYIGQAVIGTAIFYSWGLGLYGRLGPAWFLLMTIAIFALEAWLSSLWLRRFRFGPLEWIWRSLTYMRIQPMVRREE